MARPASDLQPGVMSAALVNMSAVSLNGPHYLQRRASSIQIGRLSVRYNMTRHLPGDLNLQMIDNAVPIPQRNDDAKEHHFLAIDRVHRAIELCYTLHFWRLIATYVCTARPNFSAIEASLPGASSKRAVQWSCRGGLAEPSCPIR